MPHFKLIHQFSTYLFIYPYFSKVFLTYKNNNPEKRYAVKIMSKTSMVAKNMVNQGLY